MRTFLKTLLTVTAVLTIAAPAAAQEKTIDVNRIVVEAQKIAAQTHEIVAEALAHAHGIEQRERESGRIEQVERISKTSKIGASGQLELANISGDIVVTAGAGDEVKIEAVKRGRGATEEEAKAQLANVTVEITERPGRVDVRARYPESSERHRHINVSVDYTVTAPAGTNVLVRSVSGDIRVTGTKGDLDAETVSGDVTIADAGRLARAKSVSGDIDIKGAASDGTLDLSSVSGDVVARGVKARRIEAGTVSGDAELSDATCEAAMMKSVSGDITFGGPLSKAGRYEFKSHSGDVRLTVGAEPGFTLDANTFSGGINSELPLTVGGEKGAAVSKRTLHGTYGDGSATVDVTTFSGSVVIRKR
jgi:DUF4097 and DUF4098 domain-containing protein YvlB